MLLKSRFVLQPQHRKSHLFLAAGSQETAAGLRRWSRTGEPHTKRHCRSTTQTNRYLKSERARHSTGTVPVITRFTCSSTAAGLQVTNDNTETHAIKDQQSLNENQYSTTTNLDMHIFVFVQPLAEAFDWPFDVSGSRTPSPIPFRCRTFNAAE